MQFDLVAFQENPDEPCESHVCKQLLNLMPSYLRKVQSKRNWDPKGEFSNYLRAGEAPADALADIRTSDNALSIWEIDDQRNNLERVLAAIASRGEHLQKMDHVIVESTRVQHLGVKIEKKSGDTHDSGANSSWHYDLTHLSATDLARLANCLLEYGKSERQLPNKLVSMVKESIQKGFVDQGKLDSKMIQQLSK